jgi:hypothetical protein
MLSLQATLLKDRQNLPVVATLVDMLHFATSKEMMLQIMEAAEAVIVGQLQEGPYYNWLKDEYVSEPWLGWHVSASGRPGVTPSNQPEESYNRCLKRDVLGECFWVMTA